MRLDRPADFRAFKRALGDLVFANAKITSLEAITQLNMLDMHHFKKENLDEYNAGLCTDGETTSSGDEYSRSLLNKTQLAEKHTRLKKRKSKSKTDKFKTDFIQQCYDNALKTGQGFLKWVYIVYLATTEALSADIAEQVSSCKRGDLMDLLNELALAVGNYEKIDSANVQLDLMSATMANQGSNDVMKFLSFVKYYLQRLKGSKHEVTDEVAQQIVLRGLDASIFDSWILHAEDNKFTSLAKMEQSLKHHMTKDSIAMKLKHLVKAPIGLQIHSTAAQVDTPKTKKIKELQEKLRFKTRSGGTKDFQREKASSGGLCFKFVKGIKCTDKDCKFAHVAKSCTYHPKSSSHSTAECKTKGQKPETRMQEVQNDVDYAMDNGPIEMYMIQRQFFMTGQLEPARERLPIDHQPHADFVDRSDNYSGYFKDDSSDESDEILHENSVSEVNSDFISGPEVKIEDDLQCCSLHVTQVKWFMDGMSNTHMCPYASELFDLYDCNVSVRTASNSFVAKQAGKKVLFSKGKDKKITKIVLANVLVYHDGSEDPKSIVSELKFSDAGCVIRKQDSEFTIHDKNGKLLLEATRQSAGHFYHVCQPTHDEIASFQHHRLPSSIFSTSAADATPNLSKSVNLKTNRATTESENMEAIDIEHLRRDHLNKEACVRENPTLRMPKHSFNPCLSCAMTKEKNISHDKISERNCTKPDEGFSLDFKGPFKKSDSGRLD